MSGNGLGRCRADCPITKVAMSQHSRPQEIRNLTGADYCAGYRNSEADPEYRAGPRWNWSSAGPTLGFPEILRYTGLRLKRGAYFLSNPAE